MEQSDTNRLPNFFIIGAAKSGTTSLYHYLSQHPQISMSRLKETNFFVRSDFREALPAYLAHFEAGRPLRGEASPRYSAFPYADHVPERIHSIVPHAKHIYLVRDPVDRAIAHYYERFASNRAPRSIESAFADLHDPRNLFVCASKYRTQVSQYLQYFDRSALLIIDSQDLLSNRPSTLRLIFSFLGAEPGFTSHTFEEEFNTIGEKRRPRGAQRFLRHSAAAAMARRRLPASIRRRLFGATRHVLSARVERKPAPPELRVRLADVLRDDINSFREFTGRSFDHWSV